jgi:hypothetical protein
VTVIRVTRIETRPNALFGVVFGRTGGRSVYTIFDRDLASFYAVALAEGRGLELDVPSWKVEDVPK